MSRGRSWKNKKGRFSVFAEAFLWVCMLAALLSVSGFILKLYGNSRSEKEYNDLSVSYSYEIPIAQAPQKNENPLPDDARIPPLKYVNVAELRAVNPDYVAWITFGTDINYPVVQSNNDYYLTHNFFNQRNSNGCLLIDSENRADFSDLNTVVWGHNMKSKAMFGRLQEYRNEEYYKEHPYFWILTPKESLLYKIVSVHDVKVDSAAFYIDLTEPVFKEAFQKAVYENRMYETEDVSSKYQNIVTLCTCDGNHKTRLMVHGRLIWKESIAAPTKNEATTKNARE